MTAPLTVQFPARAIEVATQAARAHVESESVPGSCICGEELDMPCAQSLETHRAAEVLYAAHDQVVAAVLREAAVVVRAEASRSGDAQRASDLEIGLVPIGTSTVNEVEWHQMGNWAQDQLTGLARVTENAAG